MFNEEAARLIPASLPGYLHPLSCILPMFAASLSTAPEL
jgi:hypothetical protein